jgi:hypothetical protein
LASYRKMNLNSLSGRRMLGLIASKQGALIDMTGNPSIAVAITAKNERSLLPFNIAYHRHTGIEHFYVYLDETDDTCRNILDRWSYVTLNDSITLDELPNLEESGNRISELFKIWESHHTARQMINAHHARLQAREAGYDWLISIDADELIYPITGGPLGERLNEIFDLAQDAEIISLRPLEILPRPTETDNIFAEACWFMNVFETVDGKLTRSENTVRKIYDPFNDQVMNLRGYLGHKGGKMAVRTIVDSVPNTVHDFVGPDYTPLRSKEVLSLLHYNTFSYSEFIKKYRNFANRADTYAHGNKVKYVPKMLWTRLVNSGIYSEEQLLSYYQEWVAFSESTIAKLVKDPASQLVWVDGPSKTFKELNKG